MASKLTPQQHSILNRSAARPFGLPILDHQNPLEIFLTITVMRRGGSLFDGPQRALGECACG
jgi:hypothetical protein